MERPVVKSESKEQIDPSKIVGNIYIEEEVIIPDDPVEEEEEEEDYESPDFREPIENYQVCEEDSILTSQEDSLTDSKKSSIPNEETEIVYNNCEEWKKYKKMKKHLKKKNNQVLEIFRDENYCNEDRYTDDEDFNYSNY